MKDIFVFYKFVFTFSGVFFSPKEFEEKTCLTLFCKYEKGEPNIYTNRPSKNGWGLLKSPKNLDKDYLGPQQKWVEDFIKNELTSIKERVKGIESIDLTVYVYANESSSLGFGWDFLNLLSKNKIDFLVEMVHKDNEDEVLEILKQ